MAGQAPPQGPIPDLRSMEELLQAPTDGVGDAIVVPPILANQFELKTGLLNLVTAISFHGFKNDDPHSHIRQPPNSITTWNDLVSKFVNHFFPPSKTTNLRNEITRFQQRFGETFAEAWDQFKDLLNKCPHHGFSPLHQIDTFYNSLSQADQDSLNSAAGVQTSRNKPQVASASGSSAQDAHINSLTKQVEALLALHRPVDSTQNEGVLPSNTVPNPREDLKAITTRSGVTLAGPSVPPPISSSKEPSPASTELPHAPVSYPVIPEPNPHQPSIPYPSRLNKEKLQEVDPRVPLILGRPFMRTTHALVDVHGEKLTLRVGDEELVFNVESTSKYPRKHGDESIHKIDILDITCEDHFHESLSPSLTPFGDSDFLLEETGTFLSLDDSIRSGIDNGIYDSEGDILFLEELLNKDPTPNLPPIPHPVCLINETEKIKSSIDDPPDLELKDLPPHLEYAYLEGTSKLPVIIAKDLKREEKEQLLKILMEDDFKPAVQHQRRVNPKIHEVIKAEVIKLLYARLIYPISDSPWDLPVSDAEQLV
ncbi:reverse transcriptase domain-containing protein [Tanacetum coccineum]